MTNRFTVYIALGLLWLGMAAIFGREILRQPLSVALILVIVFAIPIYAATIYSATIRKIYRYIILRPESPTAPWLTGRLLSSLWWGLWSIGSSLFLLLYFSMASEKEWIVFLVALSTFFVLARVFAHFSHKIVKRFISAQISLSYARSTTALIVTILYLLLLLLGATDNSTYTLDEAIGVTSSQIQSNSPSLLVRELASWTAYYEGIKLFVTGNIRNIDHLLYVACIFGGSLAFFYSGMLAFSAFMTPWNEYRRVIGPVRDSDVPPSIAKGPLAVLLVSLFVSISMFVFFSHGLDQYLEAEAEPDPTRIEMIGEDYYVFGTVQKLAKYHAGKIETLKELIESLEKENRLCRYRLDSAVDQYIGWYVELIDLPPRQIEKILGESLDLWESSLRNYLISMLIVNKRCDSMNVYAQEMSSYRSSYNSEITVHLSRNQVYLDPSIKYHVSPYPTETIPSLALVPEFDQIEACYGKLPPNNSVTVALSYWADNRLSHRQDVIGWVFPNVVKNLAESFGGGTPYPSRNLKKHIQKAISEALCL